MKQALENFLYKKIIRGLMLTSKLGRQSILGEARYCQMLWPERLRSYPSDMVLSRYLQGNPILKLHSF